MEKGKWIAYAVVLGPAILSATLCIIVELLPRLKREILTALEQEHTVEFAKEMVAHAAFYGSAVAAFLGSVHESFAYYTIAAWWFALCTKLAYILVLRLKTLQERNDHV